MNTTNESPFGTLNKTARIAGLLYLMYILAPILNSDLEMQQK